MFTVSSWTQLFVHIPFLFKLYERLHMEVGYFGLDKQNFEFQKIHIKIVNMSFLKYFFKYVFFTFHVIFIFLIKRIFIFCHLCLLEACLRKHCWHRPTYNTVFHN